MAENEEISSLEKVRRTLYDPSIAPTLEVPRLREEKPAQSPGWEKLKEESATDMPSRMSGAARFFIGALIFFVVTAGGAAAYLVYGGRSISTNNVAITLQGPTTTASGDVVPLLISIENKNPVAMHGATLTLTFPEGTKSSDDPTKALTSYVEEIGEIPAGGRAERTVRATIFGSENQHIALPVRVEYRSEGSNSVFVKDKQYEFIVTTSPLSLTISSLSQVSSGQPVTVDVVVRSNATTPLNNVAISAVYPFGFTPSSTTPKPTTGTLFVLGTLTPGEEKRISITGTVSGENNDDRVFKFTGGTLSSPDSIQLATSYTSKDVDIKLTKPFLATTLTINHDSSDAPVVDPGSQVQVTMGWLNTLASAVTNAQIAVQLSGPALDASTVYAPDGFYRSSDSTVLFDGSRSRGLKNLQPGDTGQATIQFSTKKGSDFTSLRNPTITMLVSVAGQRIGEARVPETVRSSVTRVIKVGTNLGLTSKVLRTIGPISNTGPWPLKANKESTLTVQYGLTNTVNAVAGAKVLATLPSYVRYTGQANPSDGSITYNEASRTITWSPGDIPAGTSVPKSISFQVAILPSVSQQGGSPVLVLSQSVTGFDRFTGRQIEGTVGELTTRTPFDPANTADSGTVQP